MVWLGTTTSPALADSFSCPKQSEQTGNNSKRGVNVEAQALLKLGSTELKGNVDKFVVDLYIKYSNADRVAIARNLFSEMCYLLNDSRQLSESEEINKLHKVFTIIQLVIKQDIAGQNK
jgi:hypothetical protein